MTGQLEVMQESARAAVSYARANLQRLGVEEIFLRISIFTFMCLPAIPKDGHFGSCNGCRADFGSG